MIDPVITYWWKVDNDVDIEELRRINPLDDIKEVWYCYIYDSPEREIKTWLDSRSQYFTTSPMWDDGSKTSSHGGNSVWLFDEAAIEFKMTFSHYFNLRDQNG